MFDSGTDDLNFIRWHSLLLGTRKSKCTGSETTNRIKEAEKLLERIFNSKKEEAYNILLDLDKSEDLIMNIGQFENSAKLKAPSIEAFLAFKVKMIENRSTL